MFVIWKGEVRFESVMQIQVGVSVRDYLYLLREEWSEPSSVATYVALNKGVGAGFWVDGNLSRLRMRDSLFCCNCRKNPACKYNVRQ